MTVSVRRMTAGSGYRYLMQTVAVGDGDRRMSTPLTRYYTEPGTPPGRWMGAGLAGLDGGRGLEAGSIVSEDQLAKLLGMALDPVNGQPLGAAPQRAEPDYRERVHARISALPAGLAAGERRQRIEQIQAEERARPISRTGKAVAAFDLTMSVPKSVSTMWAVADAHTQELIVQAHHAAVADALTWAERNVFATRTGGGGATQVGVRGVVAVAFDHYDSRANDPHLHTHVVVANRVQSVTDEKWRTLDSRALFRAVVALSELHQGLLMDRLTGLLGVGWDGRSRRHSPVPQWEITGVPDELRTELSRRSDDIEATKQRLVEAYLAEHGRAPSAATVLKLRQQATLETRPDKHLHSLAELTDQWRDRARGHIGEDTVEWAGSLSRAGAPAVTSGEVDAARVQRLAEESLAAVAEKRATFTRWNVYAEAQRQLHGTRFATATDRQQVGDRVTDSALGLAMLLTAPTAADVERSPEIPTRDHPDAARYTTQVIFDAEERLLTEANNTEGPALTGAVSASGSRRRLSAEQRDVVEKIATSGRSLDLLVGAAGTGKTITVANLAAAWQAQFGPGSVIGLAPSAAAAAVLAAALGLPAENTAKWLREAELEPKRLARLDQLHAVRERLPRESPSWHRVTAVANSLDADIERWRIKPNQLVILDEASLAGTLVIDRIVTHARAAGAKVLLVGDWAQLTAVPAGGAFGMLVRDRRDAPELAEVRRFTADWEKTASLDLRAGDPTALDIYAAHGRIHDGDRSTMLDAAYSAWLRDERSGRASLLTAADAETVVQLNARARADLVLAGRVAPDGVNLADGTRAGVGDRIVTRRNDRTNGDGIDWVRNGDEWTVLSRAGDGSLDVRRRDGSTTVTLTAEYLHDHVELGYATTSHRAQGRTVDTAHAVVTGPGMTRENLYVAMTRGRNANHAYVATDYTPDVETTHGPNERTSVHDVLAAVLDNVGADLTAHETIAGARATTRIAPPTALVARSRIPSDVGSIARYVGGPEL